jgi:hypothetical protein
MARSVMPGGGVTSMMVPLRRTYILDKGFLGDGCVYDCLLRSWSGSLSA